MLISILVVPAFTGTGEYVGQLVYNNQLAGIYVKNSAFIMIPMSITIISTSLLNSMGFEKKTLFYFLLGALSLILCILILPKFIGTYSLIVGYFLNFSITAILNVLLLKRVCCNKLDFEKKALYCIIICAFGCLFNSLLFTLLSKFIAKFLAMIISVIIVLICVCTSVLILKIVSLKELKIGL